MKYIFVTLKIGDFEADLKIPSDMNTTELVSVAAKTYKLNVPASAKLQAEPLGRILDNNTSFGEQGVDNGALLTVVA